MKDTIIDIINRFEQTKDINDSDFDLVMNYFRKDIVDYIRINNNRDFAICVLGKAINQRKNENAGFTLEDLQFAAYLLAIHKNVVDSLLIYEAKSTDFDTYCGFDIQLTVGGGVQETLNFLVHYENSEAEKAIDNIKGCQKAGDFDDIEDYYSQTNLPWYI
jgi:hypothetical protein